ncbi:hypothetical protein SAMN05192533_10833 [Mesobacillus persicus]|uniref:Uncharacterized protein n=1 Tax=Mesobacillus persicus TaxID=930146 RepID=A0A1H8D174_9BACI|nr:hypothetical protein [Mesobacillus persicus]SEN00966.1 hypothetical protein SAMN05192533_10833 [Mesobacillus persicus]
MLERGPSEWCKSIIPNQVAPFFHQYLIVKEYRKQIGFSDKSSKRLWDYDEERVSKLIATMPMSKWTGDLVEFKDGNFRFTFDVLPEDEELVIEWTKQICEYRLHVHFERNAK